MYTGVAAVLRWETGNAFEQGGDSGAFGAAAVGQLWRRRTEIGHELHRAATMPGGGGVAARSGERECGRVHAGDSVQWGSGTSREEKQTLQNLRCQDLLSCYSRSFRREHRSRGDGDLHVSPPNAVPARRPAHFLIAIPKLPPSHGRRRTGHRGGPCCLGRGPLQQIRQGRVHQGQEPLERGDFARQTITHGGWMQGDYAVERYVAAGAG